MANEVPSGDVRDEGRQRLRRAMGHVEKMPNIHKELRDPEVQERTLASYFGIVTERQAGFDYKLIRIGKNSHGAVSRSIARGWKFLDSEDPELLALKNPDGLRVQSDTAWAKRPREKTVAYRNVMWEQSREQLGDWEKHVGSLYQSARSRGAREVRLIAEVPAEMVIELWRQQRIARQQAAMNRRNGG